MTPKNVFYTLASIVLVLFLVLVGLTIFAAFGPETTHFTAPVFN